MSAIVFFAVLAGATDADEKGTWVNVSDALCDRLAGELKAAGRKPPFGWPTAGVAADRATGEVYLVIPDTGLWKSGDGARTFERVDSKAVGGRCETGFSLHADPRGKRLMCFMIYGGSAFSVDGGRTWTAAKQSHMDFGAVDWEEGARTLIGLKHHTKGTILHSGDGGATWKESDQGFVKGVGVFSGKAVLLNKGDGIVLSADGGATWKRVSDLTPSGSAMQVFRGVGYWTSEKGVLVSRDKGETWSVLGSPVDAYHGPYFGKDENHLVVVGKDGVSETTDAGQTWKVVAPLAPGIGLGGRAPNYYVGACYAWDPVGNAFYASSMGKPAYRFAR